MGLIERTGLYGTYWGNTYDSSNVLNMEQMQVNAKYIYRFFTAQGWTLNAIAGMLGNMQSESSINPGRWQSDNVGNGPAYSIVQWDPFTKYTNWAEENGNDASEMDVALSRILYEVANKIQWYATDRYNMSFYEFTQSELSPYELGIAFLLNYERPADQNQPHRGTQAEYWYEYLSGESPIVPSITIKKKTKFKWVIYTNKLRDRRNI